MKTSSHLKNIFEKAGKQHTRIVLPELHDDRVRNAGDELLSRGFNIVTIHDASHRKSDYAELLKRRSFTKNWPDEMIYAYLEDPIHFAAAMIAYGEADVMVCGATLHREEIVRTGIRVIGVKKKAKFVFSSTLLVPQDDNPVLSYADCSIVPEPKPLELAEIAGQTAYFHQFITDVEPSVAFISFSTQGDIVHYRVNKVLEAMQKFSRKYGELKYEGELQVDAALVPEVAASKIDGSILGGQANVLIFPNMDAGNVACKITERLAGYSVLGPKLYGLNKPLGIVSRGCSAQDIVNTSALIVLEETYNANV